MNEACPMCWIPSSATLMRRTPTATGGSQSGSTTRSRSAGAMARACVCVPIARVVGVGLESDPSRPTPVLPPLVIAEEAGELGVLDAGDVPHEPGDRVGVAVGLRRELLGVEALDDLASERLDSAVDVE